jgi:hypothetical protein
MLWSSTPRERSTVDEHELDCRGVFRGLAFGLPLAVAAWVLIIVALTGAV